MKKFYLIKRIGKPIELIKGTTVPDLRNISKWNGYESFQIENFEKPTEYSISVPKEPFNSKIFLLEGSNYKGVLTALVKHPTYGTYSGTINFEKLLPLLFSSDGIVNGESSELFVQLKKVGGLFTINIVPE
jgi:hypothetical protein